MRAPEIAAAVLRGLYLGGVRDIVIAPGSRSTPIALAAWAADVAGDLRLHVRVDERSAGFLALGLTIGSRRPVAVVTTSGTAVGNLLPAVMEAHHAGRPLVVVSADRPDRLRRTGANQTTDQAGIFGRFAPCVDLRPSTPAERVGQVAHEVCRRVGPTQLNVQLDGVLVPGPDDPWWSPPTMAEADDAEAGSPSTVTVPRTGGMTVLPRGPRTVVVAGDDAGSAARILAERGGWPLLAEPTSGSRAGVTAMRTGRLLLGTRLRREVERVIVVGHPTLSRPVTALISDPDLAVLSVRTRSGVPTDPGRVAEVLDGCPEVAGEPDEEESAWLRQWQSADAALAAAVDGHVARWSSDLPPGLLHPLVVAAEVGAAVIPGSTLVVGSSSPIRDLDLMLTPFEPLGRRYLVANRGLSGIDGVVSTAIGVALARPHATRAIALMGDLTFLHDSNGLLLGPAEPRPDLTIVVVNDDGGSIFALLEQGADDYSPAFERVFATASGADLEALASVTGTPYRRATSTTALREMLSSPARGIELVEVRASRANRRSEAAALVELARQVVDGGAA